jgi:hypothetical protein
MDTQTKFRLKKRSKIFTWLGYLSVLFFAVFLTTVLIIRNHSEGDWTAPWIMIPLLAGLMFPLFAGLIFGSLAQFSRQELLTYMRDIRIYRARKVATAVINLLMEDKIQEAVNLYLTLKYYPENVLDDYLYGMLIARAQKSDIEKLQKVGRQKMNDVKERFNPANIKF